jgi:hypothetical protein
MGLLIMHWSLFYLCRAKEEVQEGLPPVRTEIFAYRKLHEPRKKVFFYLVTFYVHIFK